ncbi:PXA domain-containing protein [Limtongia smithiae]|uniref:PXA domain-containing protein n=1 Tax=Limtongia smithiae TaxID=1125753 RepID=UPI0034CF25E5
MPLRLETRVPRSTAIAGVALALAFGIFLRNNYTAQVAVEFFILGLVTCSLLSLAAVGYFYKRTSPAQRSREKYRTVRFPTYAFTKPLAWENELKLLAADQELKQMTIGNAAAADQSEISKSLDLIIQYILRDFILSWYSQISADGSFPAQVDNTIRSAVKEIQERLRRVDFVNFTMQKLIPILTKHVAEFAAAETALRGKNLNKQFTESRELDQVLAEKYNNGELHPAASVKAPDPVMAEKEWIRSLVDSILPYILPDKEARSRSVFILVREIVSFVVILPVVSAAQEPNTWNALIQRFASKTLQDRKAVQRLRAALDKHANPVTGNSQSATVRLTAKSDERTYEKFMRRIRQCGLLSEARRLRYDITMQLKRAMKDSNDELYIRRLKNARRLIDSKILDLTNENMTPSKRKTRAGSGEQLSSQPANHDPREDYTVQQLLNSSAGLSYFMEFMDRQRRTVLLQFYLVVSGFKNPLEEDIDDSDDDPESSVTWSTSETFSSADRDDINQIYNTYFNDSVLDIPKPLKDTVQTFLDNKDGPVNEYQSARRAIMRAQSQIYETLQDIDLPKFKKSDVFLKYLTSTDPETEPPPKAMIDDYNLDLNDSELGDTQARDKLNIDPEYMAVDRRSIDENRDGVSVLVEPEDDVVQAVQAALDDIMHSRPTANAADDASSSISGSSAMNTKPSSTNEEALVADSVRSISPRSSLESTRVNATPQDTASPPATPSATNKGASAKPDLFGTQNTDNNNNIFPPDSALFEETSREIFSDDSFSSEDEMDADGADLADDMSIHQADPGDLGLTEAIERITDDINKLLNEDAVLEKLLQKAELTNNVADLRILKKSKNIVEREIRRKELQRQQYIVQESDNGLYGRSNIRINSAVSGSDDHGKAYALYIIEVQRLGYDGSISANWIVARRYSEFYKLHQHLRRRFPQVNELDFPKKSVGMLSFQKSFVETRKVALEAYLCALLQIPEVCHNREFRTFLSSQEFHRYASDTEDSAPHMGNGGGKSTVAATAAALATAQQKRAVPSINGDDKTVHHEGGQSGDFVARLYNSLTDGMDDIFGNFIVDYATHLPTATTAYNKAIKQPLRSAAAIAATASRTGKATVVVSPDAASRLQLPAQPRHIRTNSSGNLSVLTQKSAALTEASSIYSGERRRSFVGSKQPTSGSGIVEVEAELNSFEEETSYKSGDAPFIKPICDLFLELFDPTRSLRGRASVALLQQLLGGTIERKIREQILGLTEEITVLGILNGVRERIWPNGSRNTQHVRPTPEEQAKTASEAGFLLMTLIQDSLAKVLGTSNAKHGSRRLFAMLQNRILNLHIICIIVDEVVLQLFPELRDDR